ncbi:MAG: ATPase, T2SS/T4P/T4SS family, partial [Hyphomicrobiaceae bacterium]
MAWVAEYLERLDRFLSAPDTIEVVINADGSLWLERAGACRMVRIDQFQLSVKQVDDLAKSIANDARLKLIDEYPIVSTTVSFKELSLRSQIIIAPAVSGGTIMSFRIFRPRGQSEPKKFRFLLGSASGTLEEQRRHLVENLRARQRGGDAAGLNLPTGNPGNIGGYDDGVDADPFLKELIDNRMNVIISGGTSTGKTELGRRMLWMVADDERIVTIEDSPELLPRQENVVSLIADRDDRSSRNANLLLQATLRLRPDRIILGEL